MLEERTGDHVDAKEELLYPVSQLFVYVFFCRRRISCNSYYCVLFPRKGNIRCSYLTDPDCNRTSAFIHDRGTDTSDPRPTSQWHCTRFLPSSLLAFSFQVSSSFSSLAMHFFILLYLFINIYFLNLFSSTVQSFFPIAFFFIQLSFLNRKNRSLRAPSCCLYASLIISVINYLISCNETCYERSAIQGNPTRQFIFFCNWR